MILKIDYEAEEDLIDFMKNYLPDLLRDGITKGCFHGCDWSVRVEDEETRRLRVQVITEEVINALSNPPEKDELKALYRAYYQNWSKEDLQKQLITK